MLSGVLSNLQVLYKWRKQVNNVGVVQNVFLNFSHLCSQDKHSAMKKEQSDIMNPNFMTLIATVLVHFKLIKCDGVRRMFLFV